ncbi:hypothetical protein N7522_000152 [Penicillium canescens]|nr:hypothetical protein N7522_000152 [Penicillium canescens]
MALLSTLPTPHATKSFWLSELSPSLKGYRSTEVIPDQADIAVVGSGISGTFAARELLTTAADQGLKLNVVMFEAREVCSGATGRVS